MCDLVQQTLYCRLCKNERLNEVINLGDQYITSRFPLYGDFSTPKTPISLCLCSDCGLLQLYQTTKSSELYEHEYGYRSGINNTMKNHLKEYNTEICSYINLSDGDVVVDIGSNDSTMLQYYTDNLKRIGIDPTGLQFKDYYRNVELLPTYFTYDNFNERYPLIKAKVISSISMFYDLPDPVKFAQDVYDILDDDGIWTCEQSYMPTMIKTNSIDTICHEHLEYYGLTQIKNIADRTNFKIFDVKFNNCNGGSFRVYFAKKHSNKYIENKILVDNILKDECESGFMFPETYKEFIKNCDVEVNKLKQFINLTNLNNKKTFIYGASTKGNCLLQYASITEKDIKYAVERNLNKIGKMTSTGIPIMSEEKMRENIPDYLLVLPWHFKQEIIERENDFLKKGGQLIFPFPRFEIVSYKPRALITGCNGFISNYVINEFLKDYIVYGINRSCLKNRTDITTFNFDLNNNVLLEQVILTVNPSCIIHLAGISSSIEAFNNPIECIKINGLLVSQICDIIHRNNLRHIKLFNASSSEIYKGNISHVVDETSSKNMYHIHPYSISKMLGHQIVEFYRNTYNYVFSNGIIFTCESSKKSNKFLLNKLANHINNYKNPIELSNIGSYRSFIHPHDVATAINKIITADVGNDYNICGGASVKISDAVIKMYEKQGIKLMFENNIFYDCDMQPVIRINLSNRNGLDTNEINISGVPKNLTNLGWSPKYSIDDILNEIIHCKNDDN